ncbi:testis antigen 47B [Microtus ochrogaster]|uniref:Testis antigen 47B n=1 Tax=Microtus ochrogaster TaxID=79684 RepID=A0A8J6GD51_MICOH|nr:testis antigen 47B [Microtus ochrogaster]
MSAPADQDPTRESPENPVALEGEWVREAAGGSEMGHESGLDAASATPAIEEILAFHPREVDNVGPERNQEEAGDRRESSGAEEDSDIDRAVEEGAAEEVENIRDQEMVADHRFPMAGFRFMFMDANTIVIPEMTNSTSLRGRRGKKKKKNKRTKKNMVKSAQIQQTTAPENPGSCADF